MRNKRILKNTFALYIRQVLILFVSLYTLRVILNVLGVEDYGIYSVVAGLVMLLSFLPGAMASATQRFFSFAMGQNDHEKLCKTFSVNWLLYAFIALAALLALETVGLWFVIEHLKIPPERFEAAQVLYHFAVLSFIASIFSSPFIAILVAHEDMHIYAWISIVEALMKLAIVYVLYTLPWDKLELYGCLLLAVAIINTTIYVTVCVRKYAECQFRKIYWDKLLLKEIVGFTGWTLYGQLSTVIRHQAVTILINQMFNPAVVAARAVAMTVANQATVFSSNFNTGIYPAIIKSYAAGEKQEMFSLVFNGSKLTFFLMWIFALPLFLTMDTILQVWLKTPPVEAAFFTQLALVEALIFSLSLPVATAARAPGKMKLYELSLGCVQIAIFIGSWAVLKQGYPAYSVFVVAIGANLVMFVIRLAIVKKLIGLPLLAFYKQVVLPVAGVVLLSSIPSWALSVTLPEGIAYTALAIAISMLLAAISIYFVGLDKSWHIKIRSMVGRRVAKFGWAL